MLKVIGAGLGRTGTHSLAEALDILGFGPCYTILDVDVNPGHPQIWKNAIAAEQIDWRRLYSGYHSAVEWPTVNFLPQVRKAYPDAKVVLTIREPQGWYESAAATIFPGLEATAQHPDPERRQRSAIKRELILERTFDNRHWERDHAISVYEQHNRSVVAMVPQHQLLQFRVTDGWQPLCSFLEVPEPDIPFPMRNERSDFLASAPDWARKIMNLKPRRSDGTSDSGTDDS